VKIVGGPLLHFEKAAGVGVHRIVGFLPRSSVRS
jgi:hypothetical protein